MDQKRFEQIKNMERKELYNLSLKELEEAAAMGDTRCESVAKDIELDQLRKQVQEIEAQKAAEEQAKLIAEEIANKHKEVEQDLDEKVSKRVEEILQEKGVNFSNKYTRRLVEQKLHYDNMRNVYANTKYGRESLSPEMKAFIHWAKTGEVVQKTALTGGVDTNGGFLVPDEFNNEVIRKMQNIAVVRSAGARVLTIGSDKVHIPVVTSQGAGGWMAAGTQGSAYTQSEPTFSEVVLTPHKYNRIALASYEMLEDSFLNVADLLATLFAEDFAIAEDNAFLAGSGTGQPEGIDTNASVASVSLGTAFTISATDILNIVYALPRKYRNGACWFIHDAVVAKVRALQSNGVYLWTEGNLANGEPPRLAGYPVYTSDALLKADVDGGTAGNQPGSDIIFCNPRYYYIADRQGFRLQRSVDRYFDTGQVAFRADKRVDGKVALAEAFVKSAPVKH